jgi:Ni/Fe-hydrogenase subunit HybB-like protein
VLLNRVNVFFIAYQPQYKVSQYVPAIGEFLVTLGLIAALMLIYRAFVTIFPILPAHEEKA